MGECVGIAWPLGRPLTLPSRTLRWNGIYWSLIVLLRAAMRAAALQWECSHPPQHFHPAYNIEGWITQICRLFEKHISTDYCNCSHFFVIQIKRRNFASLMKKIISKILLIMASLLVTMQLQAQTPAAEAPSTFNAELQKLAQHLLQGKQGSIEPSSRRQAACWHWPRTIR